MNQYLNFLKSKKQWCMWIREATKDGKLNRSPYSLVRGFGYARADNLITLSTFEEVQEALNSGKTNKNGVKYQGINFCIYDKEVIGIDIDYKDDEEMIKHIELISDKFKSKTYVEKSPSGKGLRIFAFGKLPENYQDKYKYKNDKYEIYDNKKFLSVTFNKLEDAQNDVGEAQDEINWFLEKYMKRADYKSRIENAKNKTIDSFSTVSVDREKVIETLKNVGDTVANEVYHYLTVGYPEGSDKSSIDMRVVSKLAFYTLKDRDLIKEIMLSSSLFREKFIKNKQYLDRTIDNAFRSVNEVYNPEHNKPIKYQSQSQVITPKESIQMDSLVIDMNDEEKFNEDIMISAFPHLSTPISIGLFYKILSKFDIPNIFNGKNIIETMNEFLVLKDEVYYIKYKTMKQYIGMPKSFIPADEGWKPISFQGLMNNFAAIKVTHFNGYKYVTVNAFQYWVSHSQKRVIQGFVFEKSEENVDKTKYINMFTGYAIDPEDGEPKRILEYIFKVIANNDQRKYLAILDWCANVVQLEKNQTALVMVGKQGSGKSILIQAIEKIFGDDYAYVTSDMQDITGKFNSAMQNKVFVGIEEVLVGADRNDKNKMKDLITRAKVNIELKGVNKQTVGNHANFMAATNIEKAVSIDPDDRRYIILQVNNSYANDMEYFGPLLYDLGIQKKGEKSHIKDEEFGRGLRQFLNYLLNWQVSFDRLNELRTDKSLKAETIQRNLQTDHEFWFGLVTEFGGYYPLRKNIPECNSSGEVRVVALEDDVKIGWLNANVIYDCYQDYAKKLGKAVKSMTSFFIDLKKDFDLQDNIHCKRTRDGIKYRLTIEYFNKIFTEKFGYIIETSNHEEVVIKPKDKFAELLLEEDTVVLSSQNKSTKMIEVLEKEMEIAKSKGVKSKELALLVAIRVLTIAEYNGIKGFYYGIGSSPVDKDIWASIELKNEYKEDLHPNVELNKKVVYLLKNCDVTNTNGIGFVSMDNIGKVNLMLELLN